MRHARIEGSRHEKLAALAAMDGLASVTWRDCPDDWQAPFRPAGEGDYFGWPLQADLMPWRHLEPGHAQSTTGNGFPPSRELRTLLTVRLLVISAKAGIHRFYRTRQTVRVSGYQSS